MLSKIYIFYELWELITICDKLRHGKGAKAVVVYVGCMNMVIFV